MVEGKDNINYRRYAAYSGSIIPPAKKQDATEPEKNTNKKEKSEAKPVLSDIVRLRRLRDKLESNFDDRNTLNEYIKLGTEMGEYEEVKERVKRYLGKYAADNHTRYALAVILLRQNERKEAKLELRKILQKNPRFKEARDLLERMRLGKA